MAGTEPKGVTKFYTEQFLNPAIDYIFKYPIIKTEANVRVPIFNAILPHLYKISEKEYNTDKIMSLWKILEKLQP